jgi:hypothetical protein
MAPADVPAGAPPDVNEPARHFRTEPITCRAVNLDLSAAHPLTKVMAAMTFDSQETARHSGAQIPATFAISQNDYLRLFGIACDDEVLRQIRQAVPDPYSQPFDCRPSQPYHPVRGD